MHCYVHSRRDERETDRRMVVRVAEVLYGQYVPFLDIYMGQHINQFIHVF
jgi:hypothetical protein